MAFFKPRRASRPDSILEARDAAGNLVYFFADRAVEVTDQASVSKFRCQRDILVETDAAGVSVEGVRGDQQDSAMVAPKTSPEVVAANAAAAAEKATGFVPSAPTGGDGTMTTGDVTPAKPRAAGAAKATRKPPKPRS